MLIVIVASALIAVTGCSANISLDTPTKIASVGDHVQLDCNTSNTKAKSWRKDKAILLFAETTAMRKHDFGDIELIEDSYSIRIFLDDLKYEGVYSCSENGSVIHTYCLQIADLYKHATIPGGGEKLREAAK
ncbi:uncharacterized protein [Apostichopus japonicus]|uniref:uncharacterized protein n=1 Tax=Stichopus japonicus TaxID=307972 RepID=UPI003AB4C266